MNQLLILTQNQQNKIFHMKENNIPSGSVKPKKRVGRGEGNGHGKTCCRGHKGAGARAGYSWLRRRPNASLPKASTKRFQSKVSNPWRL